MVKNVHIGQVSANKSGGRLWEPFLRFDMREKCVWILYLKGKYQLAGLVRSF